MEGGGVGIGKFVDRKASVTSVTKSGLFVQSEAQWDFLGRVSTVMHRGWRIFSKALPSNLPQ